MHRGASEKVAFTIADRRVKVTSPQASRGEPNRSAACPLDMGRCSDTSDIAVKSEATSLAKALAPEEIRRGDFVTPLFVVSEWPSWYWDDDDALHPRDELVHIRSTPCDEATPLKVTAICLPFVLVETPAGEGKTLDVRRLRLARLDRTFARKTCRAFRRRDKRLRAQAKK